MGEDTINFKVTRREVPASHGRPEYTEYKIHTNNGIVRLADSFHWQLWQAIENIRDEEVK